MKDIIKQSKAPLSSLIIMMMGVGFFNVFITLYMTDIGKNSFYMGPLYSAYYVGMLTGAYYIHRVLKRIGHIRIFAMCASLIAISITLHGYTDIVVIWVALRFFIGVLCAALFIVMESWVILLASPQARGVALSIYMLSLYGAQALGQLLLNVVPYSAGEKQIMPFNVASTLCSLSIIPVCLMHAAVPRIVSHKEQSIFYMLKTIPFGFLCTLVSGILISTFYSMFPVYARANLYNLWELSCILVTTMFGGMALQWPIGRLSDIIPRKQILMYTTSLLFALSMTLFVIQNIYFPILLVMLFIYGGLIFTIYPLSIAYCCDFFTTSGITEITSNCLIIYGIGCILGPLTSPFFMKIKASGIFLQTGMLSLFLILFFTFRESNKPDKI